MSKVHIAIDAGGSKVNAILYDDNFKPISFHRAGSMRGNTNSPELVAEHINSLLDDMNIRGKEIGWISGISDQSLIEALKEACPVEHIENHGELGVGLAAAEIFGDGLLSLSGTGATSFVRIGDKVMTLGGYGSAVYDGGSGYWIGRTAVKAAIADAEDHGPRTLITELLAERLGGKKSRDSFIDTIFSIYGQAGMSPTTVIASFTKLVSDAADAGDKTALRILEQAGFLVGSQLVALVKRNNLPKNLPVTISGSVWRSTPIMFDTFRAVLAEGNMEGKLYIPSFEPIIGAVIAHKYAVHGKFDSDDHNRFLNDYSRYLFKIPSSAEGLPNPQQIKVREGYSLDSVRNSLII